MAQQYPKSQSSLQVTSIASTAKDARVALPSETQINTTARIYLLTQDVNGLYTPDAVPQIRIEKDDGTVTQAFTNMTVHPTLGAGIYYFDFAVGASIAAYKIFTKWARTVNGVTSTQYATGETSVVDNVVDLDALVALLGTTSDAAVYSKTGTPSIDAMVKGLIDAMVVYSGVAATGSTSSSILDANVPSPSNSFLGMQLRFTSGTLAGQTRLISNTVAATSIGMQVTFTGAPANGDTYIVLGQWARGPAAPSADVSSNTYPAEVGGNKADTSVYAKSTVASMMAYLKGIVDSTGAILGTVTSATNGTTFSATGLGTYPTGIFNGSQIVFISGTAANINFGNILSSFTTTTGAITTIYGCPSTPANGDTFLIIPDAACKALLGASQDSVNSTMANTAIGSKLDTPPASNVVASAGNALANGGIAGWIKGLWNATWKVQTTKTFNSAAISNATENDMFTGNLGAVGGTDHYRIDGFVFNVASLGGAANVVVRLHCDINGVDTNMAFVTITGTGSYTIADLTSNGTGGGGGKLTTGFASRFIRITYQFAATPTNASLSASLESSKASQ